MHQWINTDDEIECYEWAQSQINSAADDDFCRGMCLWYLGSGDQDGYDQCMITCDSVPTG